MDKIAINKKTALKMFWDAGYITEQSLTQANDMLGKLKQPTNGYYYAEDVSSQIEKAANQGRQVPLRDTKRGELFRLTPSSPVYIRGSYTGKRDNRYSCIKWDDMCSERMIKGNKLVYIGFTF